MADRSYVIQRLVFDLDFSSQERAKQLQNKISDAFRNRLSLLIEDFFDSRIPDGFLLKLEKLELDLGTIPYNSLYEELPLKLLEALDSSFPELREDGAFADEQEHAAIIITPLDQGYLDILAHFLTEGTFPWRAGVKSIGELESALADLIQQKNPVLNVLLHRLAQKRQVSRRIAYQFRESTIYGIVGLMEPANASYILQYHKEMMLVQKEELPIDAAASDLSRELWAFIIHFIAEIRGSEFSKIEFTRSTIRQMAAHYSIDYDLLLNLLHQALQRIEIPHAEAMELHKVVSSLAGMDLRDFKKRTIPRKKQQDKLPEDDLDLLRTFFISGTFRSETANRSPYELARLLLASLKTDRDALIALMRSANPLSWKKMLGSLDDPEGFVFRLLELMIGNRVEVIKSWIESILVIASGGLRLDTYEISLILLQEAITCAIDNGANDKLLFLKRSFEAIRIQSTSAAAIEPERFKKAFQTLGVVASSFPDLEENINALDDKNATGAITGLENIIWHFIVYGALPWWANEQLSDSPTVLLQQLFAMNAQRAFRILEKARKEAIYRRRLYQQFSTPLLLEILRSDEQESSFQKELWTIISVLLEIIGQKAPANLEDCLLKAVLPIDKHVEINRFPASLISAIRSLAIIDDIRTINLWALLSKLREGGLPEETINYITAIVKEEHQAPADNLFTWKDSSDTNDPEAIINYLFTFGTIPWWAGNYFKTNPAVLLEQVWKEDPQKAIRLIDAAKSIPNQRKILLKFFDEKLLLEIVISEEHGRKAWQEIEKILLQLSNAGIIDAAGGKDPFLLKLLLEPYLHDIDSLAVKTELWKSVLRRMISIGVTTPAEIAEAFPKILNKEEDFELIRHFKRILEECTVPGFSAGVTVAEFSFDDSPEYGLWYFIHYGEIPSWARGYGANQLVTVLEDLLKSSPERALQLILEANNTPAYKKRLLATFPASLLLAVLALTKSGQEVQNAINEIVGIPGNRINAVVRNSIDTLLLEALMEHSLSDELSQTKVEQIIGVIISRLADMGLSAGNIALSEKEYRLLHKENAAIINGLLDEVLDANNPGRLALALIDDADPGEAIWHFIAYGAVPWWAAAAGVKKESPVVLLQRLFVARPDIALSLVSRANTITTYRQRLLSQFPAGLLLQIISGSEPGRRLKEYASYVLGQISAAGDMAIIQNEERLLLEAILDVYMQPIVESRETSLLFSILKRVTSTQRIGGETLFKTVTILLEEDYDEELLYRLIGIIKNQSVALNVPLKEWQSAIVGIALKQAGDASVDLISDAMIGGWFDTLLYYLHNSQLPDAVIKVYASDAGAVAVTLLHLLYQYDYTRFQKLVADHKDNQQLFHLIGPLSSIDKTAGEHLHNAIMMAEALTKSSHFYESGIEEAEMQKYAAEMELPVIYRQYDQENNLFGAKTAKEITRGIIGYFLVWRSVPQGSDQKTLPETILREAGFYLFHHHREVLIALLFANQNHSGALLDFIALFKPSAGGTEALLASMLEQVLASTWRKYFNEADTAYNDGKSVSTEDTGIEHLVLLRNNVQELSWEEAIDLLVHFLQWNTLPANWNSSLELNIQKLVLHLFGIAPLKLTLILNNKGHNAKARMNLHQWMMEIRPASAVPVALNKILQGHLQTDILQYLQANGSPDNLEPGAAERWISWIAETHSGEELRAFLKPIAHYESVVDLLTTGYNEAQFYQLLYRADETRARLLQPFTVELKEWFGLLNLNQAEREAIHRSLKYYLLYSIAGGVPVMTKDEFIRGFTVYLFRNRQLFFADLIARLQKPLVLQNMSENMPVAGIAIPALVQLANKEPLENLQQQAVPAITGKELATVSDEMPELITDQDAYTPQSLPEDPLDKYYIGNAGLVLLHPFIMALLERTGLQSGGEFVDEEAKNRAVHLLQYLVAGTTEHEEHLLVLNKVLCGIPLSYPVTPGFEPTQSETDTISSLMNAVFQRWEKMANSSIEGFRHSFLIREGLLAHTDENWTLRVEQRAYDVLLTTMPWAYGVIKTPFMEKMLFVEWA